MNDDQPTQPLTDEQLVEIRNHVEHQLMVDRSVNTIAVRNLAEAVDERAILLAEVDRLRATLTALARNEQAAANRSLELQVENERIRTELDALGSRLDVTAIIDDTISELHAERNKLRARIDRLSAENSAHIGVNMTCNAKIERLQYQRNALVAKLGLDWGPDEFGDLDAVPDIKAARELHQRAHSAWHYDHCATGCGMDMNGPDPWPCDTARALGMDHE